MEKVLQERGEVRAGIRCSYGGERWIGRKDNKGESLIVRIEGIYDANAWKYAVYNAQSPLQYQTIRIENLGLMLNYASTAWRHTINTLRHLTQEACGN